jgi:DNA repair exonuclease SbcCD ATPase subunit
MDELTREEGARTGEIRSILSLAGVSSPEAFREACRARQLVLELQDKKASRMREFRQLCGPLDLEGWHSRLRELDKAEAEAGPVPAAESPGEAAGGVPPGAPLLPYLPGVEECEANEKRITADLSAAREEHARLAERVRHAFQNYRGVSEVEEDLAATQASLDRMEANRKALMHAAETLRGLARRRQEVLAPQLNRAVEQRFLRLCAGRYEEVRIDPDFRLAVRAPGSGELRGSEVLSRGTQDQLYFALRFGILDLVSNPEESAPCFLDEPFAAYDRARLLETFGILDEEAQRRQLFLFTCREDLRDLAHDRGAHILSLENP